MGRGRWLYARARRSGDRRHVHLVLQQPRGGQRQQRQLDRRGETPRIGHAFRPADALAVQFRKAVDESARLVAEILRQVDDLHACGDRVLLHPDPALPVRRTKEHHVGRREVVRVAEPHVGVAFQPAVHVPKAVARVRGAVDEGDLHLRMVDQQADQFAGGVPGASDNAGPDHFLLRFWTLWKILIWLPRIFVNPFTSSAVHALLTSPYSPKSVFIRSKVESTPTSV